MTFAELYGAELDIELGTADRTQLFTTARRKQAVNRAIATFVRQTNCTKVYGEIEIVDGQGEYDLYAFFPRIIRVSGDPSIRITRGTSVRYIQGPDAFPRFEPEELDRVRPGWRSASAGRPDGWFLREHQGAFYLGMTPAPDITTGDTWDWIVPHTVLPEDLGNDSAEPFTIGGSAMTRLRPYHPALVHYAAGLLEPLRKNYTDAQRQMQLYTGYVAQYLQQQQQDGQSVVTFSRNYLAESRSASRPTDPRR